MIRYLFSTLALLSAAAAVNPAPQPPQGPRVPRAEDIQASLPAQGQLGEQQLILAAIAHRPELERLRGSIKVATAAKRAAGDLENPELRLSYAEDADSRLGVPYTEQETVNITGMESYDAYSSTNSTDLTVGQLPDTQSTAERQSGSVRSNRMRIIERRVTPGATQDVVVEHIYETSSSTSSSAASSTTQGNDGTPYTQYGREGQRSTQSRRLVGTTRRVIQHPDTSGRDNAWGLLLRFRLPHPWERKARIQRAAAEISLAEADYFAEEDKVVRTVRGTFQELSVLSGKLEAQKRRKTSYESYRNWLSQQKNPQLGLELAATRTKVHASQSDIRELEGDVAALRDDLAAYCGISDASRIQPAMLTRHVADLEKLDAQYLTDIAQLYRSDVMTAKARLAVAQARLKEARSSRIPFASFVDLGYSQMTTLRRSGMNDELFVRVGITLPIWDWAGINKAHKVHEADSESWQRQLIMQRSLIENEVTQAIKRLRTAAAQLDNYEKDLAELQADMQQSKKDAQLATQDVGDLLKVKRIEYEFQDLEQQMQVSRYSSFASYNEALMALEKALGVRLERALTAGGGQ
jgi:outer membrane protein TolC